jgi:G:T/U-mismatch repair DNA glycosylase
MAIIVNKFREYQVSAQTEILILGTFSPDIPEAADFFYGRSRTFLWHLLPQCWGVEPLLEAPVSRKKEFMSAYNIDFADIINAVDMPEKGETSLDDIFIDSHVHQWNDIIALIDTLPDLKAVYFTKKTFSGIPLMRAQIKVAADYCAQKGIRFCKLETPSKFYSPEKLQQWIDTMVLKTTCLRV